MTGKQRIIAAMLGKPVDRPPIWLREGFNIAGDYFSEPGVDTLGSGGDLNFMQGWKKDPIYRDLFTYMDQHADAIWQWSLGPYLNRFMLIPPRFMKTESKYLSSDLMETNGTITTPGGDLHYIDQVQRNINTYWHTKHPVESLEDLRKVASIPFSFDPVVVDEHVADYKRRKEKLGDRGVMQLNLSTPLVNISANMELQSFLEMSIMEQNYIHELLEELTGRIITILDGLFERHPDIETIANIGGSEQCTPPMMSPVSFKEFIVPYEGAIIERLHHYGVPVNTHCHGRVKKALEYMVEMGSDSTDPVEPPDQGDVTYKEARKIAEGRITLVGNLEFSEMEHESTDYIRRRVHDILSYGTDRLIMAASAGPLTTVTPKLVENYRAWIDAVLEVM